MRIHYVSPSAVPSRSANAVHVVMQCNGLEKVGADVTLYAKRTLPNESMLMSALREAYGVDLQTGRVVSYFSQSVRADNIKIAALALSSMHRGKWPDAIVSRNLYAAYVIAVLERRPLIFETHQLEQGIRKVMQCAIMTRPWVTTVVISRKLVDILGEHHGMYPKRPLVLPDAAPEGIVPLSPEERRPALVRIAPQAEGGWQGVCGYFGHLYPGRGIEIIEMMAKARPKVLFLVFGGCDEDVRSRRDACRSSNVFFAGHVPHPVAQQAMRAVDVLLMPYQENVSIGVSGHDTARWMSPMKMFEYMASGVPLISSDLPVLREVLCDGGNTLLVRADDADAWIAAVDRLLSNSPFARQIAATAHAQYVAHHTWEHRARALIGAV